MERPVQQHLVISAVNIRKGGTLTVLRDCLAYLSTRKDLKVTALVHDRALADFPGIDYVEIPWSVKGWGLRLWCEYVTMHRISTRLDGVDLWFSLHDTTPRVQARRQAVYCHTSFPFLKVKPRDFRMDVKIPLFALFTRYAYRFFVRRNRYLVVQQDWFREGLSSLLPFPRERIIVAPPRFEAPSIPDTSDTQEVPIFLYPASPDCHKNFETLCEAARLLEDEVGRGRFRVILTIDGSENRYAAWVRKKWGSVSSVDFRGFLPKEDLYGLYGAAAALVFPSRVETWGLPISEFLPTGKPLLLADLPYAHQSASGSAATAFFPAEDPKALASLMHALIDGGRAAFRQVPEAVVPAPFASGWPELFQILLQYENSSTR